MRANGDLIDSVLATLVENKVVPDPFYGLQNERQLSILLILQESLHILVFTTFQSKLVCNSRHKTQNMLVHPAFV